MLVSIKAPARRVKIVLIIMTLQGEESTKRPVREEEKPAPGDRARVTPHDSQAGARPNRQGAPAINLALDVVVQKIARSGIVKPPLEASREEALLAPIGAPGGT